MEPVAPVMMAPQQAPPMMMAPPMQQPMMYPGVPAGAPMYMGSA